MIQALSERPTGFLQCFDTVGVVMWPVKIVPVWPILCWVGRQASVLLLLLSVAAAR